uniref:C1q domain-containing protein n=1 Tax=Pseudonaja textilis TaxID=8673 RepID=A0A670YFG2_PSETE
LLTIISFLFCSIKEISTEEMPRQNSCVDRYPGIPGNPGHNGLPGRDGRDGTKGIKGDLGPIGPKGQKGEIGIQGEIGLRGPIGPKGHVGPKGEIGVIARSAFSVGLTAKFPPLNVPIKFDKVLYNSFDHYSTETGVFTCQIPGVYYFTYHITVFSRNMRVALVKNEHRMLHTADMYQGAEDQASGGIVLELQKGDRIWLQTYGGETFNGLFADPDDDTVFSGFLLFSTSEAPASMASST